MPKEVPTHQCEFCDKQGSLPSIEAHESRCSKNPIVIETNRKKSQINSRLDKIRNESTSIDEVISELQKFWLELGIKVTFDSYPTRWSDSVSNSHNSPKGYPQNWGGRGDAEGTPRGYPGWTGRWSGTVEKLDTCTYKKKEISFNDLTGTWSDSVMNVDFIHTGSGSYGPRFSGDGKLFLYDFPKMHEEWKQGGNEYQLLADQFNTSVNELKTKTLKHREVWRVAQPEYQEIMNLETEARNLLKSINEKQKAANVYLDSKYAKNFPIDIPSSPSAFIDYGLQKQLADLNVIKDLNNSKFNDLLSNTTKLAESVKTYAEAYPELLV